MNGFYAKVNFLFVSTLIFFSTFYISHIFYKNSIITYPPRSNVCPDYWVFTEDEKCKPYLNMNIGDLSENKKKSGLDSNLLTLCDKSHWASDNNIAWSGISNLSSNLCKHQKKRPRSLQTNKNTNIKNYSNVLSSFYYYGFYSTCLIFVVLIFIYFFYR